METLPSITDPLVNIRLMIEGLLRDAPATFYIREATERTLPLEGFLLIAKLPGGFSVVSRRTEKVRKGDIFFYLMYPQIGEEECVKVHLGNCSKYRLNRFTVRDMITYGLKVAGIIE